MSEVIDGEIVEFSTNLPYEFDNEKKMALIGFDESHLILIVAGLQKLGHPGGGYDSQVYEACMMLANSIYGITKELKSL